MTAGSPQQAVYAGGDDLLVSVTQSKPAIILRELQVLVNSIAEFWPIFNIFHRQTLQLICNKVVVEDPATVLHVSLHCLVKNLAPFLTDRPSGRLFVSFCARVWFCACDCGC